jgi:hypothetical protein
MIPEEAGTHWRGSKKYRWFPMAGRGRRIPGAGRKKGVPNKVTSEIRALAQRHGPDMIASLVELAKTSRNDSVRVAAIREILDRGYGKTAQPVTAGEDNAGHHRSSEEPE